MKKSMAHSYSPALELPSIAKSIPHPVGYRTKRKVEVQEAAVVLPPSKELIDELNRIGREYPFCVYYKHKAYDPL